MVHPEIDEQSDLQPHEDQIGFDLFQEDRIRLFRGFEFDDGFAVDRHVHPEGVFHGHPFVFGGDGLLAFDGVPALGKVDRQKLLANGFEQAGPQATVQFQRRVEYVLGYGVFFHAGFSASPRLRVMPIRLREAGGGRVRGWRRPSCT